MPDLTRRELLRLLGLGAAAASLPAAAVPALGAAADRFRVVPAARSPGKAVARILALRELGDEPEEMAAWLIPAPLRGPVTVRWPGLYPEVELTDGDVLKITGSLGQYRYLQLRVDAPGGA